MHSLIFVPTFDAFSVIMEVLMGETLSLLLNASADKDHQTSRVSLVRS